MVRVASSRGPKVEIAQKVPIKTEVKCPPYASTRLVTGISSTLSCVFVHTVEYLGNQYNNFDALLIAVAETQFHGYRCAHMVQGQMNGACSRQR